MKSWMIPAMLSLAVAPFAVQAQDFTVDEAAVEACFEAADPGETAPGCLGQAAQSCQSTTQQGETTLGIGQCIMAETAAWDVLLNREYGMTRDSFAETPGLKDTLLKAQRAWIAFRDADCAVAYERWGGGSMRSIAAANCRMEFTARRALELKFMRGY
ncbi:lysozyme inhibitor LprI family protein [Paracoccus marinaquae]|uniref:DUF1311 domain-containing protein n=1 Tax=Paracoccus marinaquae TaxID=2841926 RepID=A0ABS6AJH3_9RHOB|nr:lysozyme inhibitor LprI family protein [Paracoccus marinaquae]MBU3030708.1 DUF1311 domain-containing protein [Paracoccus marinaquae]